MLTAAKIALVMLGAILFLIFASTLVMAGAMIGFRALPAVAFMAASALVVSQVWALATWAADRWIARARVAEDG